MFQYDDEEVGDEIKVILIGNSGVGKTNLINIIIDLKLEVLHAINN